MVTFNCEVCNETVPKKNTEKHYYRCPNAYYTCIDCNKTFDDGYSYKQHTECITEDEKYQKGLYKGKKNKQSVQQTGNRQHTKEAVQAEIPAKAAPSVKQKEPKKKVSKRPGLVKGESLYKILKSIRDKDEKKSLLKNLIVTADNKIELKCE